MIDLEAKAKYRTAIDELLFLAPQLGHIARSMGFPVWDYNQDTAYITYDADKRKIVFAINPDFYATLNDDQATGVLAHETYHMVLDHLDEMMDKTNYPDAQALIKAQECIINDTIKINHMLELPDGVFTGPDLIGQELNSFTTFEAYRLFAQNAEQGGDGDEFDDNADGGAPGSGVAGAGGDQNSDDQTTSGADGAEDSTEADSKAEDAGDGDADGTDGPTTGACGGIQITEAEAKDFADALDQLFKAAAQDMGVTEEEFAQELTNTAGGGYSPTGAPVADATQFTPERMNWRELLARINPKVLESGKKRARVRNNWTRYNRRMGAVYPTVIMPKVEAEKPKTDDDGDSLPVLVVALDLSGSIPRTLVKTLQGLLNEIPEELIKAYPCTWGSNLIPYDEEHNFRVAGGGTNIDNVSKYVTKIEKETGTSPYVLVITDGQFYNSFKRSGKDWYFMGVDRPSVRTIRNGYGWGSGGGGLVKADEEVYLVDDFKI